MTRLTAPLAAPAALRPFTDAAILGPADVHAAATIARLVGDDRPEVLLALALAVRGPRFGHVATDLTSVHRTVTADDESAIDPATLPWPEATVWRDVIASSPAIAADVPADGEPRPLTLVGPLLYLDRYWRYEQLVVERLVSRATRTVDEVDVTLLRSGLDRLFDPEAPTGPDLQRVAAATAVRRHLAVIAGGPGTGKTYTVARILALVEEQASAAGRRPPKAALVAPTGKAATRLEEEIGDAARRPDAPDEIRDRLAGAESSTIHRLLRRLPGNASRFRHSHEDPLPHDIVIVDETSMVSLALMAKLLDAVRDEARVVLLGDPEQLASVEAGAVLGDIVGPVTRRARMSDDAVADLDAAGLSAPPDVERVGAPGIGDGIVVLQRVRRFGEESGIADLARAIQLGDAERTLEVLAAGRPDVRWIVGDDLREVRTPVVDNGRALTAAARVGDAAGALERLDDLRVLCAHRRGPTGVADWVPRIERWLADDLDGYDPTAVWYVGRPVLVTENDHRLGVSNGDIGVVVATDDGLRVAFHGAVEPRTFAPTRLEAVETVHAMTIHKSQGSQFGHVVVVLPDAASPILTRELLYTAVTRARREVTVVGPATTIEAAVARRVQRASGLRSALWGQLA